MTVKNFLKMNQGGSCCISIHQLPYDYEKYRYTETYFEEYEDSCDIFQEETFKKIAKKQVDHFNIIGGGMYPVELCIYIKEE